MNYPTRVDVVAPADMTLVETPRPSGALTPEPRDRVQLSQLFRIRFVREVSASQEVLASFHEPWRCVVVRERIDGRELPRGDRPSVQTEELHVGLLVGPRAAPSDDERHLEEWLEEGGAPVVEAASHGDKVRWRAGRCILQSSPERLEELLRAAATFSFYEGELRKLELELGMALQTAERDSDLVGLIDAAALARWDRVRIATQETARRRIRFTLIEPHLEKASSTLTAPARRAFNELGSQANVRARLAMVDDRIELFEDLYTTASERLSEYSYFRREMILEIAILGVLMVEVVLLLVELFITPR